MSVLLVNRHLRRKIALVRVYNFDPMPLPRLIITGASGFLGQRLLTGLKEEFEIVGFARRSQARCGAPRHENISWFQVDIGEIAVKGPDPVMFLEYWKNPSATREKYIGAWLRTGDYGRKDKDGNLWFSGRQDDIIESGGFRIGPGEVEACLMKHQAVALVGVIGVPDPIRGEIVKAFILPKAGVAPDKALEESIKEHVKKRLEAHAYPREVVFIKKMPMTKTGKILKHELRRMHETGL